MRKYYLGIFILWVVAAAVGVSYYRFQSVANEDKQRVADLTKINDQITAYVGKHDKLPVDLRDVQLAKLNKNTSDYIYKPGVTTTAKDGIRQVNYELCATFKKETKGYAAYDGLSGSTDYLSGSGTSHKAGYQCFKQQQYISAAKTNPGTQFNQQ